MIRHIKKNAGLYQADNVGKFKLIHEVCVDCLVHIKNCARHLGCKDIIIIIKGLVVFQACHLVILHVSFHEISNNFVRQVLIILHTLENFKCLVVVLLV